MKKQLVFGLVLMAVAASWGCNDDIKVEHRTFEQLCINSGGSIDSDNNQVCRCSEKKCLPGIVCVNNGEFCADTKDICDYDHIGDIACKRDSLTNDSVVKICQANTNLESNKDGKSDYSYEKFELADEQIKIYKSYDKSGECKQCVKVDENKVCVEFAKLSCNGVVCGECLDGDISCRNQYGNEGIYECLDGKWKIMMNCLNVSCVSCSENDEECLQEIAAKPECGNCLNGDIKCENDREYTCENGLWRNEIPCSDGSSCNVDGTRCSVCINGATKCENGILFNCAKDRWNELMVCPNSTSCKSDTACGECHDGDVKCENDREFTCEKGGWGNAALCPDSSSCNADGTRCSVCINGSTKCEKGVFYNCVNDRWNEAMSCPNGTSCKSDTACGECHEGSTKCETDQLSTCEKGQWVKSKECDDNNSCNASGTACGECVNGKTKCENGIKFTCVNGAWANSITCPNNASCNAENTDCGECHIGDTKCKDGQIFECEKGQWVESKKCDDNNSCNASGTACGECVDGATKCENGIRSTCVYGYWANSVTCPNNASCNLDNDCGECNNEDIKCELHETGAEESKITKAILVKCVNGKWPADADIVKDNEINNESNYFVQECDVNTCAANGKLCGSCDDKVTKCIMGSEYTCNAGTWGAAVACSGNASCKSETKCGKCANNSKRCVSENSKAYTETCYNGEWVKDIGGTCDSNECDSGLIACKPCEDGKSECVVNGNEDSGTLRTCVNGKWEYMVCPSGICEDNNCRLISSNLDMVNGGIICINVSEQAGYLHRYDDGEYKLIEPCRYNGNEVSCRDDYNCGVCKNDSFVCRYEPETSGSASYWPYTYRCSNGRLVDSTRSKIANCEGSECKECPATEDLSALN